MPFSFTLLHICGCTLGKGSSEMGFNVSNSSNSHFQGQDDVNKSNKTAK